LCRSATVSDWDCYTASRTRELKNRCTGNRTGGSNPSPSASYFIDFKIVTFNVFKMCPICARLLQVRRPFSDDLSTADVDLFHQIINMRLTRPGPLRVMPANNLRGIAELPRTSATSARSTSEQSVIQEQSEFKDLTVAQVKRRLR
jgi:hypothetical protein